MCRRAILCDKLGVVANTGVSARLKHHLDAERVVVGDELFDAESEDDSESLIDELSDCDCDEDSDGVIVGGGVHETLTDFVRLSEGVGDSDWLSESLVVKVMPSASAEVMVNRVWDCEVDSLAVGSLDGDPVIVDDALSDAE